MSKSSNLIKAKTNRNDEFYTQLIDIERELIHYKGHFKDKTVYLNCDNPDCSNFWVYFHTHFSELGLKKLISTYYGSPSYKIIYTGGDDDNIKVGVKTKLDDDGDFRSEECQKILKEADIVVTNPPFSLFNEYMTMLIENDKQFIVIGNNYALYYKEIFSLLRDRKVWLGYSSNKTMIFEVPDGYDYDEKITKEKNNGKHYGKVSGITWFTNIDIDRIHKPIILTKTYKGNESNYPRYDNYDAIDVSKIKDIPKDYDGLMGVPITFFAWHCVEQFEIVACSQTGCHPDNMVLKKYRNYKGYNVDGTSNGRTGSTCGNNPMIAKNDGKHAYYMNDQGHTVQSTFGRLFIRRKNSSI